jgi:hypothetical protein
MTRRYCATRKLNAFRLPRWALAHERQDRTAREAVMHCYLTCVRGSV